MASVRDMAAVAACALAAAGGTAWAQSGADATDGMGPYDVRSTAGSAGLVKEMPAGAAALGASAPFTLSAWIEGVAGAPGPVLLASLGGQTQPEARRLGLDGQRRLAFDVGGRAVAVASTPVPASGGHLVAATYDGQVLRLVQDGRVVAQATLRTPAVPAPAPENEWQHDLKPRFEIVPRPADAAANQHFAGVLLGVRVWDRALSPAELGAARPPFPPLGYEETAKPWPVQVREQAGYTAPQPPSTLPQGAGPTAPSAKPAYAGPGLPQTAPGRWTLAGGWRLASALDLPKVDGAYISQAGYDAAHAQADGAPVWMAATVPGTVLTTLVDRGVYPDPAYGLNNLHIPESLARHDWWYRTELDAPASLAGRRTEIVFNGINYASEVWLNGERLGGTTGAFIRGRFDVTGRLKPGARNVLAVRVSPPPHPGIPHEQSIKAGVGENGGAMMLDGPTFGATEGWDWIPGVRDRNTGVWQDVQLHATGAVRLGDPKVVTTLPLPDRSRADVAIAVAAENLTGAPVEGEVAAAFDDVRVVKRVTLQPGANTVTLSPAEFPQLRVRNPKLWWPNGYGEAALHDLRITVANAGAPSDERRLRFGIREITYELSAFDDDGKLQRVEFDPSKAGGRRLIDGSHEGIHDAGRAYAVSLTPGAQGAPGLKPLPDDPLSPFLVVRVNGERIAIRGGAWGMDDFMKRVGRERLEPYFRLNRDAHMNILRNWVGQDTEEALYDLADQYGILVWNDFWESTQDYNLEAQDPQLFLKNAADVVSRFQTHPSIMVWIGRNEGVPQPILNEGLEQLTREIDGTRYYAGSSNRVNLQNSGPYKFQPEEDYFTKLSKGYAVEVGLSSFSTLEGFKAAVAPADQWPISDAWAYHDWHQTGNGDMHPFMAVLATRFGAPTSLEDFERKAQMMNYDGHRAVFEGLNAGLWRDTSGRMLWMTQPAWPSNVWQIYGWDYDTSASYYGAMHAAEPVHVQLNLADDTVAVVNTTREPLKGVRVRARIVGLDGRELWSATRAVSAGSDGPVAAGSVPLDRYLAGGPVLVALDLADAHGAEISRNVYWRARTDGDYRGLNALAPVAVAAEARRLADVAGEHALAVTLRNPATTPVLAVKLTLKDAAGARVLPAYYSDNYVSLLPGETRTVSVRYPQGAAAAAVVAVRGWNARAGEVAVR